MWTGTRLLPTKTVVVVGVVAVAVVVAEDAAREKGEERGRVRALLMEWLLVAGGS